MHEVSKTGLRIAGLLLMAICVSHCGDSSVHIRTGNGTNPSPGTFTGFTDQGGNLTIQVGSIEAIAFDCEGSPISATFSPPREVNADGTFDVQFSDAGRKFHVSGRFTSNDDAEGIIDDANNQCDTGFTATRSGPPTSPTVTKTPGGQTPATRTPTPVTSGPTETPTVTSGTPPTEGTMTPSPTPTGEGSCPTLISFTGTSTGGVLDTGWTGQGHDATTISDGTVTVSVTNCAGSAPPCGVCSYTGPVENTDVGGAHQLHTQRCLGDNSGANGSDTFCTSNADCPGAGNRCTFFFGSYLPLAAGGVATCVGNAFTGGITGTANVDTGSSAGTALLQSRVYSGPLAGEPCPRCVGDATANDGVKGGTCSAGQRAGQTCDASGASPNAEWGTTSLDCPPLAGGKIADLAIDLSNTTGNKTRTLSASSPNCRAPGFTGQKCQCDTCNNAAATVCASNADCPGGGICGGKRCVSGNNNGAPCTTATECPGGGACTVVGTATAPNQCDGGATDCGPGDNDPPTSANDHICGTGPFEQFCGPTETFRGCTGDTDCKFAGDTCSVSRFRECFDTGTIGDTVTASGKVDKPNNHASNPTLAALFCVGPTASGSVNSAAGLPGLGRLEIGGHSADNGTP